jgi:hypothetical protein
METYVHQNPGTHLNGGITDDAMWQGCWHQLNARLQIPMTYLLELLANDSLRRLWKS